jgi:hypothetical protein
VRRAAFDASMQKVDVSVRALVDELISAYLTNESFHDISRIEQEVRAMSSMQIAATRDLNPGGCAPPRQGDRVVEDTLRYGLNPPCSAIAAASRAQ